MKAKASSIQESKSKTKTKTTNIKLHDKTVNLPVKDVVLNDWNPNFVPSDIKQAIADDITQNGFVGPIVVQKYNERMKKKNVIINGEHRFNILKDLGGSEVPAIMLDIDDTMAKVLTIRLNREHGELLPNRVGKVLNMIAEKNKHDLEALEKLTAYRQKDLEALMTLRSNDLADVLATKAVSFNAKPKTVKCPSCGNSFQI